jgi:hypothetical protein
MSFGVMGLTQTQSRSVVNDGQRGAALSLAEAGVDHVIWRLRQAPDSGNNFGPRWRDLSDEQDIAVGNGTYAVKKLNVENGVVKSVVVEGFIPSRTAKNAVHAEVVAEVTPVSNSMFAYAVFGDKGVSMQNGDTDSYDSRKSTYNGASVKGQKGDAGTNAVSAGALSLGPNGHIGGNALYPKTGSSAVVSGGTVSGMTTANPNDSTYKPVPVPPVTAVRVKAVNQSGNGVVNLVRADDNSVIPSPIPAGDYIVEASGGTSISLSGQAELNFAGTGTTRLWLMGNMDLGGQGLANAAELPTNLLVYGMEPGVYGGNPGCASINIHGNGAFYGAVYAPVADITVAGGGSSGDVFGSLMGRTVSFSGNGTGVHFDEALLDLNGGVKRYHLHAWTQTK